MIYRDFNGVQISNVAFGAMRFPTLNGKDSEIDEQKAQELVDVAMEAGINYYDTAWGYHGGNSEIVLGKCLKKHPRDKYFLATKFPSYDVSNFGDCEGIFEKQLEKCQTDYFDFYLLHNVNELNIEPYLDDCKYGTVSYFLEEKAKGRIKHLGFSAHGNLDTMRRFVEKYGKYMEFGMIQLNYVDYMFQEAKAKMELLNEHNIPVWVMEPLRGGMLAKMDEKALSRLQELRPGVTPVEIAFRFLQSLPGVTTILTGMTEMNQMKEKIAIFEKDEKLSGLEMETLMSIADEMVSKSIQPCTSCRYCMSHCPKGLDIPKLLSLYNENAFSSGGFLAPMGIVATPKDKRPSACIGCRACEKVCPQNIKISEVLKELDEKTAGMVKFFDKS